MNPPMPMKFWTERAGTTDQRGNETGYAAHVSDADCYWWMEPGDEAVSESRSVTVASEHVITSHGVDVDEGDRVVKVVDHEARTVFDTSAGDVFREVEYVVHHRDFIELILARAG